MVKQQRGEATVDTEAARRWLSPTYDLDLAEAARVLPDCIWRSLRPE